jgi:hypothetical protein
MLHLLPQLRDSLWMVQHTALASHVLLIELLRKVSDQHHVQVCGAGVRSCIGNRSIDIVRLSDY